MAGMWIRAGSVSVTSGSKKVIGSGTGWVSVTTNKPAKGHTFWGPDTNAYEIDYVESDTVLYLADSYSGPSVSGQPYRIDNTRDSSIPALSRKVSEFYAYQQGYIDALAKIVTGSGDVIVDAPDGQQVTVPALSNMLSKSGNLAGLGNQRQARVNLGLTAGSAAPVEGDINIPSKLMRWEHYGGGYTIFDASLAKSPTGQDISRIDAQHPWIPTYPSLMGWNGSETFGLHVDSAREAGRIANLASAGIQPRTRSVSTNEAIKWFKLGNLDVSSLGTLGTIHLTGYIGPWSGGKIHFDLTIKNRGGISVTGISTARFSLYVYDVGGGAHEVWLSLPPFYLCEMNVFAAGNGSVGFLFGDVVATAAPAGSVAWDGTVSCPVLLQYDVAGQVTVPGVTFTADKYKNNAGNPAAHEYSGVYQPLLQVESAGTMEASDNRGYWIRNGVMALVHGVVVIKDTAQYDYPFLLSMPFIASGADNYYPVGILSIYNATLKNGIRTMWMTLDKGSATARFYCIDGNGVSRQLKPNDITSNGNANFRFSIYYGV